LAIAAVLNGSSREEAAEIGGMDRQTLRDWVIRARGGNSRSEILLGPSITGFDPKVANGGSFAMGTAIAVRTNRLPLAAAKPAPNQRLPISCAFRHFVVARRCAARRCAQTGQGCDCDGDGNVTGGGDVTGTGVCDVTNRSSSSHTVMTSVYLQERQAAIG
jgi:hypothetical protein